MSCAVMRCIREGAVVVRVNESGAMPIEAYVCAEHLLAMQRGEEWVWRPGERLHEWDQGTRNPIFMGDDLLQLNEWVVLRDHGMSSGREYSNTPESAAWVWTFTARQRGSAVPEEVHLVLTREQRSQLFHPSRPSSPEPEEASPEIES